MLLVHVEWGKLGTIGSVHTIAFIRRPEVHFLLAVQAIDNGQLVNIILSGVNRYYITVDTFSLYKDDNKNQIAIS